MLYGQIKPIVVKVTKSRFRYLVRRIPRNKPMRVISFDMKYLLIADDKAKVHKILWKDTELVISEPIVQVPVVQMGDQKIVNRIKERNSLFKSNANSSSRNSKNGKS